MADYNGKIIIQAPLFGNLEYITISGIVEKVSVGVRRKLLLIDDAAKEIISTTFSSEVDGTYEFQVAGSPNDTYSVMVTRNNHFDSEISKLVPHVIGSAI